MLKKMLPPAGFAPGPETALVVARIDGAASGAGNLASKNSGDAGILQRRGEGPQPPGPLGRGVRVQKDHRLRAGHPHGGIQDASRIVLRGLDLRELSKAGPDGSGSTDPSVDPESDHDQPPSLANPAPE